MRKFPRWVVLSVLLTITIWMVFVPGRRLLRTYAAEHYSIALPEGTVSRWMERGMISQELVMSPGDMLPRVRRLAPPGGQRGGIGQRNAVVPKPVVESPGNSGYEETVKKETPAEAKETKKAGTEKIGVKNNVGTVPKAASKAVSEDRENKQVAETGGIYSFMSAEAANSLAGLQAWTENAKTDIPGRISDYACIVVKQERINGKLREEESFFAKFRHKPYSVYMKFVKPRNMEGREAIYVTGRNGGNLIAHGSGLERMFGNFSLVPTSSQAMDGNLHPITENGMMDIIRQMLELCDRLGGQNGVRVTLSEVKLNGRECVRVEIVDAEAGKRAGGKKSTLDGVGKANFFIDKEYDFPVRYAYWSTAGELMEERTYLEMKLNVGFTDGDFDQKNRAYNFK